MNTRSRSQPSVVAILLSFALAATVGAQTDTTFVYQGELKQSGLDASGSFDLEFSLWDAESNGNQIGSTLLFNDHPVADGRIAVDLDFGAAAFYDSGRWLELVVDGELLLPRQPVTRAPYAIQTRGIRVRSDGNVGVGTFDPLYPFHVQTELNSYGMFVRNTAESGFATAARFDSDSVNATALQAWATADTGSTIGLRADASSTAGKGVYGWATAGTGLNYGVYGHTNSTGGVGVFGWAATFSGQNYAVRGRADSSSGYAGYFEGGRNYFEGNVGIGTTSPTDKLHVVGNRIHLANGSKSIMLRADGGSVDLQSETSDIYIHSSGAGGNNHIIMQPFGGLGEGNVGIRTSSPSFNLEVNGSAGKPGGGSWSSSSDRRLKKKIEPLLGSLDSLLALRGVTFEYIDPDAINELAGVRIGMIAQDVEAVFPDWVDERDDGYFAVTYRGFEALTVEALRDLRAEKDAEINALRAENQALRERLDAIEQLISQLALHGAEDSR